MVDRRVRKRTCARVAPRVERALIRCGILAPRSLHDAAQGDPAAIRAGILHLGGTRLPAGWLPFGLTVTMDARQGVGVFEALKLPKMIPVHFDDYTAFASPLADFKREMERRGWGDRIIEIGRGKSVTL